MNYTYLLRCADGSLYCGWTSDLAERIRTHNAGRGARYTRSRRPVTLAYYEEYATRSEAMKREAAIKKMTKLEKEVMVREKETFRIIISPAKRMRDEAEAFAWSGIPEYIEKTQELLEVLKSCSESELMELFAANETITHENFLRYRGMNLKCGQGAALLMYVGLQYQYMAPHLFSGAEWEYACRYLRILSGFYGILRPDDGIVPYRLEMQTHLSGSWGRDLYAFWGDRLFRALREGEGRLSVLNLASKEYSRAVESWLRPEDRFVTCVFGTLRDGKVRVKATEAKMARGEMVRFMAGCGARDFETVKSFEGLGFSFDESRSGERELVFLK